MDDLEEQFICYLCRMDAHAECVGVPCMCDCPDPKQAGMKKCCFKGCEAVGRPQEGFDFYACSGCLERLEMLLNAQATAQRDRS